MRIPEWRLWLKSVPRSGYAAALIVLLALAVGQRIKGSRLEAELSRFQAGHAALLRERAALKDDVQAWKTEAVEYRVKYNEPEPSSDPPIINESEREILHAPGSEE